MSSVELRSLAIELDGLLRIVPGQYHMSGPLAGKMITDPVFQGQCEYTGVHPTPVRMALYRPLAATDPRLVVVDSTGSQWVLSFRACHDPRFCKISGFFPGL